MIEDVEWQPYDPSWLISLAKEQHPEETWLVEALAVCTRAKLKGDVSIYFVDAANANKPGSEWQFERNILLDSPTEGPVILDVLKGQKIGGVEFYGRPGLTCPCGFTYNYLSAITHNWITIHNKKYADLKEIELQLANLNKQSDNQTKKPLIDARRALQGRFYQCPTCGRIMWRKPGESKYQVFVPEKAD